MTTFVRDKQSYLTLFIVIILFGTHNGLKIDRDKTDWQTANSLELGICEFKDMLKF